VRKQYEVDDNQLMHYIKILNWMAGRMTGWMGASGRGWKKKSFKVESSSSEENSKKNNFFFFFFSKMLQKHLQTH
jgi:hypothetical protein